MRTGLKSSVLIRYLFVCLIIYCDKSDPFSIKGMFCLEVGKRIKNANTMMSEPLISVIIPMYNASATIERALHSVMSQTGGNFEILVVDDGSSDNSAGIVARFINENADDNHVIRLIRKENGGVSTARNAGLMVATGRYIALLDADDCWLPNKTEKQLQIFASDPHCGFVGCIITEKAIKQFFLKKFDLVTEIRLQDLVFKNFFQPSTVMMKREVYEQVGLFEETQRYAEEGNYFMRIARTFKCVLLNEKLIIYGNDEKRGFGISGLSANLKEMEKGELRNLRFVYSKGYINLFVFNIARLFSLAKYARRVLLTKLVVQ